ncbi:MAG: alpha amylase N-terminal ig-like domain-containing protein [Lachnospiraceae bacterium]|nr:alpha amylase N-terminal ig-like domain-containing protein [Lachnospiraceae bacterium]
MNLSAIYHRCSDSYCYCLDDTNIIISIRTDYDVTNVTLMHNDPFINGIMGGNNRLKGKEADQLKVTKLENHLMWTFKVTPEYKRLAYYFIIESEDDKYVLCEDRIYKYDEFKKYKGRQQLFMYSWMNPSDIIKTPDWVNDTVWYQIFIDRFCNGDPSTDPENVLPWKDPDKTVKYDDFYGGDLKGITSKIDYLKNLGITGLYLTPICQGSTNHKYDTKSYTKIDPHFGSDEDMAEMVKAAHDSGIRVMMDGVFNHSGPLFKPWQDVVENGPQSKYYDWFMVNKWPFDKSSDNSKKKNYYSFAFVDMMPKLNTNNEEVIKYIVSVIKNWIEKYDIDAIRLDVSDEISHTLCKRMHRELKKIKPDFYILGEAWHDSMPWLRGDEFDSVMNYPLTDSINDFWLDSKKTAKDFEYSINRCFSMYPMQVNKVLFNLLDSHDTERLITKLSDIRSFYQQFGVLFTMPGTVCIYYGTEIALEGGHDPDCRRCMPWKQIMKGMYYDKIERMKKLIAMRKEHQALRSNNYEFTHLFDNDRVISYKRISDDGAEVISVVINCSDNALPLDIKKKDILFQTGYADNMLAKNSIIIYNI